MKYGILTFSGIPNYGAVLQAYALCKVLRDMGTECEIIDYTCENIVKRELEVHHSDNLIKELYRQFMWKKYTVRRIRECTDFIVSRGMLSSQKYDTTNITSTNGFYDAFITGSDMVWDSFITGNDLTYFLDFTEDGKKRIAYGPSDGNGFDNSDETKIALLKKYSSIGVRESNVCAKINEYGIECSLVADPTMLITTDEWQKISKDIDEDNYVLVCFPSKTLLKAASDYAKSDGKRTLVIADRKYFSETYKCLHIYDPAKWLGCIKNASAVFTDSYHGILFSMYFQKPFFTNNNGNRTNTVLQKFGLTDRELSTSPELFSPINYTDVSKMIAEYRNSSLEFLKKAVCSK